MADSPVLYVYYRPDNDDAYPGVPARHITEADWARFSPSQRRIVQEATTQEGYTRRKVWVHRDLVDETEQERADREAAEQAAREAYERGQSIVRWRDFEPLVPGPGEVIVGTADGPVAVKRVPVSRNPLIVSLGDSITAAGVGPSTLNWLFRACTQSKGKLVYYDHVGIGGYTTAQIRDGLVPQVLALAPRPGHVAILAGANDLHITPFAQWKAAYTAILDRLTEVGITPIVCAILPKDNPDVAATIYTWNVWLNHEALRRGIPFINWTPALMDPASMAGWKSGYTADGVHPNNTSATIMGDTFAAEIEPYLAGINAWKPYLTYSAQDPTNRVGNGLFTADANGDGIADGWITTLGSGVLWTPSIVPASDGVTVGNWQRVAGNSGNTTYAQLLSPALTGISDGDVVEVVCRVEVSKGANGKSGQTGLRGVSSGTAFSNGRWLINGQENNVPATTLWWRGSVTVGASPRFITVWSSGEGYQQIAQATVRNLTALGLA